MKISIASKQIKYYHTLVKTNIYIRQLYSENLLMCLKRVYFPFSDFFLIIFRQLNILFNIRKLSMKSSWGLLKIDSLYLIFIISYIFYWTFDIYIKKEIQRWPHRYCATSWLEVILKMELCNMPLKFVF